MLTRTWACWEFARLRPSSPLRPACGPLTNAPRAFTKQHAATQRPSSSSQPKKCFQENEREVKRTQETKLVLLKEKRKVPNNWVQPGITPALSSRRCREGGSTAWSGGRRRIRERRLTWLTSSRRRPARGRHRRGRRISQPLTRTWRSTGQPSSYPAKSKISL